MATGRNRYFLISVFLLAALSVGAFFMSRARRLDAPKSGQAEDDVYKTYFAADPDSAHYLKTTVIGPLKIETFERSISRLDQVGAYYMVIPMGGDMVTSIMPLEPHLGEVDLDRIFCNRRFLKVYQELHSMEGDVAARSVAEHLRAAIPIYRALLKTYLEAHARENGPNDQPLVTGAQQISDNEDGSPSLSGIRLKILSLCLIAGNLGHRECERELREIALIALSQYRAFTDPKLYNLSAAHGLLMTSSLFHRQVLGIALAGVIDRPELTLEDNMRTRVQVPGFEAMATPYDRYAQLGLVPVDWSKGKFEVQVATGLTDADLIKRLEIAAQEK